MSKRFLLVMIVGFCLPASVFAVGEEDSPSVYCAEEARDVGLVDENEIRTYVAECMELIRQESGDERNVASHETSAEAGEQIEEGSARMD